VIPRVSSIEQRADEEKFISQFQDVDLQDLLRHGMQSSIPGIHGDGHISCQIHEVLYPLSNFEKARTQGND